MEAILLSGVQGAGKSTWCRERYWDTHLRLNYDMLRTRHREAVLLAACLATKQKIVIDATNPTRAARARYVLPCREAGYRLIGLEFEIALALALARNATRTGKARVPDLAIHATARKREPMTLAEGLDEVWRVEVGEAGSRAWRIA